jgi:hypothetical protein
MFGGSDYRIIIAMAALLVIWALFGLGRTGRR